MYSLVLMMSMTAPADVPQGIIFNRPTRASAGCAGGSLAVRVRETVRVRDAAPLRTFAAAVNDARPHLVARWFGARAGCAGGTTTVVKQTTTIKMSCAGVAAKLVRDEPPTSTGAESLANRFLQRAAVHRTLHRALRQGTLTTAQAKVVRQVLDDPDLYEAAVTKVHRGLLKDLAKDAEAKGIHAQAIGDGTLLKLLLDNLDKIIAAIKQIIEMFGLTMPPSPLDGWAPMPIGPHAPARVVPSGSRASLAC